MSETPRCAVLGSPVAHSLSPVLHRAAYRDLGLSWTYDAFEVDEDELAAFVGGLTRQWRGLSLTMPLKRRVIDLCHTVEPLAATLQSVNTVVIDPDGVRAGHNTDVGGFVDAFRETGICSLRSAVILGAGATSASALAALARMGAATVTVLARTPSRAAALVEIGATLGVDVAVGALDEPWAELSADALVSTLPATAQARVVAGLAWQAAALFDVAYDPRVTPLIEQARVRDVTVVDGFALLLHQAGRQVELMTGTQAAPLESMRAAGLAELEQW
jgi:shikimate dehydrogenase